MYIWYIPHLNQFALSHKINMRQLLYANLGYSVFMVPGTVDPMED